MTRSIFGWDLPPGVTLNDIENAMGIHDEEPLTDEERAELQAIIHGGDEEISTTGALNAILDDPLADEEDGLTGKPYGEDETPITPEEAQEVIEEMRRRLHLAPLGLESKKHDFFKEEFNQQYELALKTGNARFGSECSHAHTLNGHCINCFRPVVTL